MRIGIDLKPFNTGSKFRGIGMYSRELIKEILRNNEENEYHFLNIYEKYDGDPVMGKNCYLHQYNMGPKIVDVGERQLFRDDSTSDLVEATVKHFIEKSKIDVMLFTSPTEYGNMYEGQWFDSVFTVGILYDLIPLVFPDQCLFNSLTAEDYYKSLEFLKSLDLLLAISQSAKDDAVRLLGIPEDKIVVIYAGIDTSYRKLEKVNLKELKKKYRITDSFIMFAGGIDFKKNIEDIIVAYSKCGKLVTNKYQLVIVGKASQDVMDKYLQIAKDSGVENRVICTGFIPQKDLVEMYNVTDLLVFPSLYEGFGLPVIEAMACGARVVTSNCSSLKEVAEGYATLVSPKSVKSIANGIKWVFDHPVDSMNLADKAVNYALSFTWSKVAKLTLEAIQNRYFEKEKKSYSFEVSELLVKNIARLYSEHCLPFDMETRKELAGQLVCIQEHGEMPQYNVQNRILYDMTVVHEWIKAKYSTGIGRVSKELYYELSDRINVIPVILTKNHGTIQINKISLETYEVIEENIEISSSDIYFMPEIQLRGVQVDKAHPYVNELRERGIKTYAVVYDILPLRMPQYFERKTSEAFDGYVREIIENYDGVLCDSQFVADDVMEYCSEKKIHALENVKMGFFHLGQDTFEKKADGHISGDIKNFFDTEQNIYLMLGTVEPRKGHEIILNAFEKMWDDKFEAKLCIVGHVGWNMNTFIERIRKHKYYGEKLAFFEGVSDKEVEYVYENSDCLIQASAGEGFGLPLIEASNYNLPILCSDIPVFHEVAGNNANYFDRNSLENVIKAVEDFEQGDAIMESKGIEKLSWKQTADKVYEMIVNNQMWYKG